MIRVLISASSPQVRARLVSLLRSHPEFEVREEATLDAVVFDGSSADWQPDVVLAEPADEEAAADLLDHLESNRPTILLVSLGIADAFRQRYRAVLPKDLDESRIVTAIEAVAAGLGVFMPDEIAHSMPESSIKPLASDLIEPLTPREIEILRAMADGLGNKEIGTRFGISENTVKFHVGSVMGKLGAGSRTEAVILGIRHGVVFV